MALRAFLRTWPRFGIKRGFVVDEVAAVAAMLQGKLHCGSTEEGSIVGKQQP